MVDIPDYPYAKNDTPLKPFTWYGVGGPADIILMPRNREEMLQAWKWIQKQNCPTLVLGGGTNVLIGEAGFRGAVLLTKNFNTIKERDPGRYCVNCGVVLDRLVREVMLENNYAGVGALAGIPGSVGGAIYMNAGTANGSICEILEWVEILGTDGVRRQLVEPPTYDYRRQAFCRRGEIILSGGFRFETAREDQKHIYDHYLKRRRLSQPSGRSCGSVFKNPEGDHAGRLLEACGLKGERKGGAVVSQVHANFIMNDASATYDDIVFLMRLCRHRVRERFGLTLEPEVKIVGEHGLINL